MISSILKTIVSYNIFFIYWLNFLVAQPVNNLPTMRETWVQSLDWEDPLEKGKAPTPVFWPGQFHGLQSMGWKRVRHGWVTFTFTSLSVSSRWTQPRSCCRTFWCSVTNWATGGVRCSLTVLLLSLLGAVPLMSVGFQPCSQLPKVSSVVW